MVELSALPKVHFFCGQKVCILLFFWKTLSPLISVVPYSFVWGSIYRFHIEEWLQPVHHLFIFEDFWTKFGLKVLFKIPTIWEHLTVFVEILFIFTGHFTIEIYKTLHIYYPQGCNTLLGLVLNMPSDFSGNIYIPKSFVYFTILILLSVNSPLYQLLWHDPLRNEVFRRAVIHKEIPFV